MRQRSYNH